MGKLERITEAEATACYRHAVDLAKTCIRDERGYISPNARISTLSDWEWRKLAVAHISGWIQERAAQVTIERVFQEEYFLATGEIPEPSDLATAMAALPALGDFIEKLGLADRPIGDWSKQDITLFVWTAFDLVREAQANRLERPSDMAPAEVVPGELLMAG